MSGPSVDPLARRKLEERAAALAATRAELARLETAMLLEVGELLAAAEHVRLPMKRLAELLEVSRPTLYRWRDAAEAARAACRQADPEGRK
jgi:hypothetical protein